MSIAHARPPLVRSEDRLVAGVCSGLARHLGLRTDVVRWAMVIATLLGGAGIVFYGWLWIMVPTAAEAARREARRPASSIAPAVSEPAEPRRTTASPAFPGAGRRAPRLGGHGREVLLGAVLLLGALAVGTGLLGLTVPLGVVVPVAAILGGAALAWLQLDESRRTQLVRGAGTGRWVGWLRLGAGLALVVAGVTLAVSGSQWNVLGLALLASLAVLAGVALVLLPWGVKFWRDFGAERAARVREAERAEIAAHLHDSVLQTLALIQRRAGSEADVTRLARAQERELREWLYRDERRGGGAFADRLKGLAAEVEDAHGQAVDVVCVGDASLREEQRERIEALLQASREAMLNAVRHGGGPVSVYAEASHDAIEVFVKDRGPGFEPDAVPEDRLGVRESIVGRMRRHGGEAKIVSGADGTEVRLRLPGIGTEES
ncbi:PspC domain-containing protein [Sinomonas sp. JGH33]|uniref:PspC domain-containing protein n=1 Tax=Sinomonas terricola TaxID=3110330 RepID=A0ABU5T1H7_9MICC|nr:PspC domain-containing protein [Sinomonas sp. JGH33]MEA5453505.1 PspC domain-containing protein [Sinomonas sp. JGH33]